MGLGLKIIRTPGLSDECLHDTGAKDGIFVNVTRMWRDVGLNVNMQCCGGAMSRAVVDVLNFLSICHKS